MILAYLLFECAGVAEEEEVAGAGTTAAAAAMILVRKKRGGRRGRRFCPRTAITDELECGVRCSLVGRP